MRAVLKTNDAVSLSYATSLLAEAGIEAIVFDTHASIMDGSLGMLPRRIMVADEDYARAGVILRGAMPDATLL